MSLMNYKQEFKTKEDVTKFVKERSKFDSTSRHYAVAVNGQGYSAPNLNTLIEQVTKRNVKA